MLRRLWIYQRERFPLAAHAPLIAVFSSAELGFSAMLRSDPRLPAPHLLAAAFVSSLLFFLQLRISDEFKDHEEDARYRPYRAVPRGLVTLQELGRVALGAAVVQLVLVLLIAPALLPLLALTWGYLLLLRVELFIGSWLKPRPLLYLLSHMPILPLIAFYSSAWDWATAGAVPPGGLPWLLVLSFFGGIAIEVGRKTRAPQDEEPGVETYSGVWGESRALAAWLSALALAALSACMAAHQVGAAMPLALLTGLLFAIALASALRFRGRPSTVGARRIEQLSGLWMLLTYAGVGLLPLLLS